ncbi:MAG TPA: sigma-70 family RNA polymerase sigma factor [Phycisphaerae bacterium]|nr:sigma-70 family RNA polymerase sigma factor [Phycisphaerae bacterium]
MTENQIVEACRRGDRQAQRELYARTCDRVYRVVLRMLRNHDDTSDVAQDTYLRAFGAIGKFDGSSSVDTWLYRIAVNEALQFLRRRKRQSRLLREHRDHSERGPRQQPNDARLDVEEAVARLPEAERALIVLRYYEGLSYAQMAEVLNKPAGTIASGLNRARAMLKECLEPRPGQAP